MGEAADDAFDAMLRNEFSDWDDYYDPDYDDADEASPYWSEWRKDHVILARHIKNGGASREATKLGALLRKVVDPWDGWEPL